MIKAKITEINWNEYFYYCESSPTCLRWKVDVYSGVNHQVKSVSAGDVAGQKGKSTATTVGLQGQRYLVHRVIYQMFHGNIVDPLLIVDHEDGDDGNNKIGNLRLITHTFNAQNCSLSSNNKSGFTGVSLTVNTRTNGSQYHYWSAHWQENGKRCGKHFSVDKFGYEESKSLAILYREATIERLNLFGASYTSRHGR